MLTKNTDLIIVPADPFKNDCLERKPTIVDLTNLVQSTNQPFVFSVEAPWGWGKTTFIRLWKAYLEQNKHPCLYFNAWSNDFAEDPMIAFLSEMSTLLEREQDEGKNQALISALRRAQKIGVGILRRGLPVALRVATQGIIDEQTLAALKGSEDELSSLLERVAEERIQAYEQGKRGMKAFRDSLAEFARLSVKDETRRGPVIFFVDELDRCRPDYAVALLERIKHLFNVEGVVFVLSIDRKQLVNSVKAIYGNAMDADGYLRRFIDLSYRLSAPPTDRFINMLFDRFYIHEFFTERHKDKRFPHDQFEENELRTSFTDLATIFQFSLRVQEQCLTEINIVLRTTGTRYKLNSLLLSFVVAVKNYRSDVYQLLHQEKVDIEKLLRMVKELLVGTEYIERLYEPAITAYIIRNFCTEQNPCKTLLDLRALAENARDAQEQNRDQKRAQRILANLERLNGFDDSSKALSYAISRLDHIGNFVS